MPDSGEVKWIFVTGGVLSGLGKGLVSASVSRLLQDRGIEVVPLKCDGYLNVDPGTMNPHEHGEVFVLEDGTEVDMDFGHYERFLDIDGKGEWNLTSGKVFQNVIEKERNGEYLGKTVQMVPHVTKEIKDWWRKTVEEEDADVAIIEVGGTVGDMENELYLEAARQIQSEDETFLIHTTLVPYLETTGEQKTKPTQHSIKDLRERGLKPDMIIGRSRNDLEEQAIEKISLFGDVPTEAVISEPNLETIYEIPLIFDEQDVDRYIADQLDLPPRKNGMKDWRERVQNLKSEPVAEIGIIGKYMDMEDSYASVEEALKHAAADQGGSVEIKYMSSEDVDGNKLRGLDGVIIPGGFGERGIEGKIEAIEYCRNKDIPVLGLCYGMQLMVVEYARNVLGLEAVSQEWDRDAEHKVVAELPGQKDVEEMGGTMRLGAYTADINGRVSDIYGSGAATERHRHRYEINPEYTAKLEENGLQITGKMKDGELAEYIEIPDKNFFIGTQAHPEFTSRFQDPNPLYLEFLREAEK